MKLIPLILTPLLFYSCSTKQLTTNARSESKILRFERTAIMDTITVVIHGHVVDVDDGRNISTPSIDLRNDSILYYGAVGDTAGNFKFNHIRAGQYTIRVNAVGYHTKDTTVILGTGEVWECRFGLVKWSKEELKKIGFGF